MKGLNGMESVLIVITLVSLLMTIVLGVILARLVRDDRRRSAARVAVLREMADEAARQQDTVIAADEGFPRRLRLPVVPHVETPAITADDMAYRRSDDLPAAADLFVREQPHSPWPQRLAVAATIAVLVSIAALALKPRSTPRNATDTGAARDAAAQTAGLLELVSLEQTQESNTLTITGRVQNPRDGAALSKIIATALLFAADGTLLASGRAPLDFTVLRPGDESVFVINVPVTAPVARYRVGFRSEDGRVIGHVDRRAGATMADHGKPAVVALRGAP